MKIGLATTTVHVPFALKLLRKCDPSVKLFVAGDKKTPQEAYDLCTTIPGCYIFGPEGQKRWKCSEALGWNTIARRNIAFLEALQSGADVIYSWDTDNYPIDTLHYDHIRDIMRPPVWHGIKVTGQDGWFDAGAYLRPPAKHRGFPIQRRHLPLYQPVTDVKIGVAASLILNDPDVDACTRIACAPDAQQVSLLAEAGVVVDPYTHTVFNTQSTAVVRELVPAWFLMPGVGRMDDIYSSLVVQRVARERGYHVHFGKPFVVQQRHEHDLVRDMRAEIDGYENVVKLADLLDHIPLPAKSVIEDTRIIYEQLCFCGFIPQESASAGLVWLEDVESVL